MSEPSSFHVAIIGGGITGLTLAIGLERHKIQYTVFERSVNYHEIGAGLGFGPNAERAMMMIDSQLHQGFKAFVTQAGEDYMQWVNAHETNELMYRLYLGKNGLRGGRRADFLDVMSSLVPRERVKFSKEIMSITDNEDDGRVKLYFNDGTTEEADLVVGCDGIHSRVRQHILGPDNPAAYASYSQKFCFRTLVTREQANNAVGDYRASSTFMYNGPNAHAITYPVAKGAMMNVLIVVTDTEPWTGTRGRNIVRGNKAEAVAAFKDWHPCIRAIADLLPDQLDKWGIFDMVEHPADTYVRGRVTMAGDAAHAAGPHLGAGAGFGIEDSVALTCVLEQMNKAVKQNRRPLNDLIKKAFQVYNDIRYDRTQWLPIATREAVDLIQWRTDEGRMPKTFGDGIRERFYKIWDYDLTRMVQEEEFLFWKGL